MSGAYFANSRRLRPKRHALDDEAAERLWALSASLVADFEKRASEGHATTESTS